MTKRPAKNAELRNVEVRAIRAHSNMHGAKFEKAKGDVYLHPRPASDIAAGLIEIAQAEPVKAARSTDKD